MPWLQPESRPPQHTASRRVAVLAAAMLPLVGCGEDQTRAPATSAPAAPRSNAPTLDVTTAHELDNEMEEWWRILADMSENDGDKDVVYEADTLFEAVVVRMDPGPPEISVRIVYRHFDPRYYLTLRLITPPACMPEWRAGDVVAFHIHSPALLFENQFGHPEVGNETRFALRYDPADGIKGLDHAPVREEGGPGADAEIAPPR